MVLRRAFARHQEARYLAFSAFVSEHWVDQLEEPELRPLIKNVTMLREHVASFKQAFAFMSAVVSSGVSTLVSSDLM